MTVPLSLYNSLLPTGCPYITLLNSTGTLAVLISLWYFLLTFYWPTGSPYITLLHYTITLAVHILYYYTLLANLQSLSYSVKLYCHTDSLYITRQYSTDTVTVALIALYNTQMDHWQSLSYSTILYWPNGSPYINLLYSAGSPYITLSYSTGPLTVAILLNYTQLGHW